MVAFRNRDWAGAERVCRQFMEQQPANASAWHLCGLAAFQQQRADEAIELLRTATEKDPESGVTWNDLGNVLLEAGRHAEAVAALQQAVERRPEDASIYNSLGLACRDAGDLAAAERSFRRSVELAPRQAGIWSNLGRLLQSQDRWPEAVDAFQEAVRAAPNRPDLHRLLVAALRRVGRLADAGQMLERWLLLEPANPVAKHLVAAVRGDATPDRASDDYLRQVFDPLAETFDDYLQELEYSGPERIRDGIAQHLRSSQPRAVVDLGCGTGWCAPILKPLASRLVGVDLSRGMLEQARALELYDELVEAEMVAFLTSHPGQFDLIVAADTLLDCGDLYPFLKAARAAARPNAGLIFTLERLPPSAVAREYLLQPNGRYAHSAPYVETCLKHNRWRLVDMGPTVTRREAGISVPGLLVVARA